VIDSYEFGSMTVMGEIHHRDLKIIEDRVIGNWWREEAHALHAEDIADILDAAVKVLVVGTGASGNMEVTPEVTEAASRRGIELVRVPTREAVGTFNNLHAQGKRVAGAFHLTC
jgi:hypothetical protein